MSSTYNAEEILQIAEKIELNGAKFYRRAAENAADEGSRSMLLELAEMEDGHYQTFVAMRESLPAGAGLGDPDGLAAGYLGAFADGAVFDVSADPSEDLSGDESPEEIIRIAIGLEKDSIALYVGLRAIVPAELGRDKIEDVITEEMGHVTLLAGRFMEIRDS